MDNEITPSLRIGDMAPVFDADTTQGKIHFPMDFNGKWIILFSHPSDFTPVCTSEFLTFGAITNQSKITSNESMPSSSSLLSSSNADKTRSKLKFNV